MHFILLPLYIPNGTSEMIESGNIESGKVKYGKAQSGKVKPGKVKFRMIVSGKVVSGRLSPYRCTRENQRMKQSQLYLHDIVPPEYEISELVLLHNVSQIWTI